MKFQLPTAKPVDQLLFMHDDQKLRQNIMISLMNEYCHKLGYTAGCTYLNTTATCDLLSHVIEFDLMPNWDLTTQLLSEQVSPNGAVKYYPSVVISEGYDGGLECQKLLIAWRVFLQVLEQRGYAPISVDGEMIYATLLPMPVWIRFVSKVEGITIAVAECDADEENFHPWVKEKK